MDYNANTLMRDTSWNEGKGACTRAMHPDDASRLGLSGGSRARVVTEASSVEVELELTSEAGQGHIVIPHGLGLNCDGKTYWVNVNRFTSSVYRDPIAGTPLHRYVPCRMEPI